MDALINTYFSRFHGKPYQILDESSVRQRLQLNQLPEVLCDAIGAVAARFTPHPHGHMAAVRLSEQYAFKSRNAIAIDEPSVDSLQALLLLVLAFTAAGKGKKAFMAMSNAVGMTLALELHREADAQAQITPVERENRRNLFWSAYLLDRYLACGSKRPSLISDESIVLRLPSWSSKPSSMPVDGEFFHCGSNLQYLQSNGKKSQGTTGLLIDITRVLGITNRYLAAGGVKGDSHFPWHSLSNLSKIRQDLDIWASSTNNIFSTTAALFGQSDSTVLVLSKLIYHLIHCLIYRPFLPIDLSELAGNGQHQSWQIEATNMCFLHANAIAELVDLGFQMGKTEWPPFIGFCISTAGTVHVHGAHYNSGHGGDLNVFTPSADYLARELQHLNELRYRWSSIEYQRVMLQNIRNAHADLLKGLANNDIRYTPGFQLEDFFDRYANVAGTGGVALRFESASLTLSDIPTEYMADVQAAQALQPPQHSDKPQQGVKRKNTAPSNRSRPDMQAMMANGPITPAPSYHNRSVSMHSGPTPESSTSSAPVPSLENGDRHVSAMRSTVDQGPPPTSSGSQAGMSGFAYSPASMSASGLTPLGNVPFSPSFTYALNSGLATDGNHYDPMFSSLPTNAYSSPAAWQNQHEQQHHTTTSQTGSGSVNSPSNKSNTGSTGTQNEEKDPFLTLLEQLAENEQRFSNGSGSELDFFLAGAGTVPQAH